MNRQGNGPFAAVSFLPEEMHPLDKLRFFIAASVIFTEIDSEKINWSPRLVALMCDYGGLLMRLFKIEDPEFHRELSLMEFIWDKVKHRLLGMYTYLDEDRKLMHLVPLYMTTEGEHLIRRPDNSFQTIDGKLYTGKRVFRWDGGVIKLTDDHRLPYDGDGKVVCENLEDMETIMLAALPATLEADILERKKLLDEHLHRAEAGRAESKFNLDVSEYLDEDPKYEERYWVLTDSGELLEVMSQNGQFTDVIGIEIYPEAWNGHGQHLVHDKRLRAVESGNKDLFSQEIQAKVAQLRDEEDARVFAENIKKIERQQEQERRRIMADLDFKRSGAEALQAQIENQAEINSPIVFIRQYDTGNISRHLIKVRSKYKAAEQDQARESDSDPDATLVDIVHTEVLPPREQDFPSLTSEERKRVPTVVLTNNEAPSGEAGNGNQRRREEMTESSCEFKVRLCTMDGDEIPGEDLIDTEFKKLGNPDSRAKVESVNKDTGLFMDTEKESFPVAAMLEDIEKVQDDSEWRYVLYRYEDNKNDTTTVQPPVDESEGDTKPDSDDEDNTAVDPKRDDDMAEPKDDGVDIDDLFDDTTEEGESGGGEGESDPEVPGDSAGTDGEGEDDAADSDTDEDTATTPKGESDEIAGQLPGEAGPAQPTCETDGEGGGTDTSEEEAADAVAFTLRMMRQHPVEPASEKGGEDEDIAGMLPPTTEEEHAQEPPQGEPVAVSPSRDTAPTAINPAVDEVDLYDVGRAMGANPTAIDPDFGRRIQVKKVKPLCRSDGTVMLSDEGDPLIDTSEPAVPRNMNPRALFSRSPERTELAPLRFQPADKVGYRDSDRLVFCLEDDTGTRFMYDGEGNMYVGAGYSHPTTEPTAADLIRSSLSNGWSNSSRNQQIAIGIAVGVLLLLIVGLVGKAIWPSSTKEPNLAGKDKPSLEDKPEPETLPSDKPNPANKPEEEQSRPSPWAPTAESQAAYNVMKDDVAVRWRELKDEDLFDPNRLVELGILNAEDVRNCEIDPEAQARISKAMSELVDVFGIDISNKMHTLIINTQMRGQALHKSRQAMREGNTNEVIHHFRVGYYVLEGSRKNSSLTPENPYRLGPNLPNIELRQAPDGKGKQFMFIIRDTEMHPDAAPQPRCIYQHFEGPDPSRVGS